MVRSFWWAAGELDVTEGGECAAPGVSLRDVYFMREDALRVAGLGENIAEWIDDHGVAIVERGRGSGVAAAAIAHEDKGLIFDGAGDAECAAVMLPRCGPARAQREDGGGGECGAEEFGEAQVVADGGADGCGVL